MLGQLSTCVLYLRVVCLLSGHYCIVAKYVGQCQKLLHEQYDYIWEIFSFMSGAVIDRGFLFHRKDYS